MKKIVKVEKKVAKKDVKFDRNERLQGSPSKSRRNPMPLVEEYVVDKPFEVGKFPQFEIKPVQLGKGPIFGASLDNSLDRIEKSISELSSILLQRFKSEEEQQAAEAAMEEEKAEERDEALRDAIISHIARQRDMFCLDVGVDEYLLIAKKISLGVKRAGRNNMFQPYEAIKDECYFIVVVVHLFYKENEDKLMNENNYYYKLLENFGEAKKEICVRSLADFKEQIEEIR